MSTGTRICSGRLSDFEALGVGGNPVYRVAAQIKSTLRKEYGSKTSNLFATLVRDEQNNAVDWYTELTGDIVKFNDCSIEQQLNFRNAIETELANVRELSERYLLDQTNETALTFGKYFQLVQIFPSDDQIYIVGQTPVIVFWGFKPYELDLAKGNHAKELNSSTFTRFTGASQKVDLSALHPETSAAVVDGAKNKSTDSNELKKIEPSSIPIDGPLMSIKDFESSEKKITYIQERTTTSGLVAKSRSRWQRFGWWLFLLILIIIGLPSILKGCSADFPLYDAKKYIASCPDGGTPVCTKPKPKLPESKPPQSPTQTKPQEQTPPLLDPKSLEEKNLDVFKGAWVLDTPLKSTLTDKPISIEFTFSNDGSGSAVEYDGVNYCKGAATAKISSKNAFDISHGKLECPESNFYRAQNLSCTVRSDYKTADCSNMQCVSGECKTVFRRR